MSIKGILFDKDGTLLDFHATWMPAYGEAARMLEREAGRAGLAARLLALGGYREADARCDPRSLLACGSTSEIAELWAMEAGLQDVAAITERIEEVFAREAAGRATPVTDLAALFARLAARGMDLGVATMDSEALAHATLRKFGVDDRVRFVCGYDSGFGHKPEPGMAEAFCRACSLEAGEVAMVGDTPHDLDMGRAAGVGLVVGVLTGASTGDMLAPLCDHVIDSVASLESVLPE